MAAQSGRLARIRYTSASATSSTNNAADLAAGGLVLTINSTAKRLWNRGNSSALVVYAGSTAIPAGQIEKVDWVIGKLTLSSARSTSVTYTIDVETYSASYMTGGRSWGITVDNNLIENTAFSTSTGDVVWRTFQPGLNSATVEIGRLISTGDTGPLAYDRLAAGQDVIIELWNSSSTGADRWAAYGFLNSDSVSDDLDGLAEEALSITVDGDLYWSTA